MYFAAPGHQHIELLAPRAGTVSEASVPPRASQHPRGMEPMLIHALEAALGGASAGSLASICVPAVRAHIRAQQRARPKRKRPGAVRIISCHAREGGEFFGSVEVGGKRLGYAARIEGGKLVSFKVL